MHRGVRRNTLRASSPTFRGAISIEVYQCSSRPKEVILVRSRQSKTRSLWMKKPTVVIDSVTFIASKSSRTFSSPMIDPPPAPTCGSSRNRFVEAAA